MEGRGWEEEGLKGEPLMWTEWSVQGKSGRGMVAGGRESEGGEEERRRVCGREEVDGKEDG